MANTSPARPIRLRILGGSGVTNYPNELLADFTNKKLSLYNADGGNTIDFYSELTSAVSGSGNAVTSITVSGRKITITKGSTFLTAHPTITKSTDSTSNVSPALGGTFTAVDSVTRDTNGHVTKINLKTITLPSVTIPDVSKYVKVGDESEMVDENPETLDGHTAAEFILKTEVVNNLTSASTNLPLSAAQGKALNDKITSASSTASSASTTAAAALAKSGGTMTGALVAQSNANYTTRQVRNVVFSTSAPSSSAGQNGDIWFVYTA